MARSDDIVPASVMEPLKSDGVAGFDADGSSDG